MPDKTREPLEVGVPPLCPAQCTPASHLPHAWGGMHAPWQRRRLPQHFCVCDSLFVHFFFKALHGEPVFDAGLDLFVMHREIFLLALSIVLERRPP